MSICADHGRRLGLIVNPVAGLGGRVGLKGSDGAAIQQQALRLGAVPQSLHRAAQVLERLKPIKDELMLYTYPAEMGEEAAKRCGLDHTVIGSIVAGQTTAADTARAAREMQRLRVDLLLFAGGDGTARDIIDAIDDTLLVLGIPTGVKMQSAVFAVSPISAGDLALASLQGRIRREREAEVMDIDEDALRQGIVTAKLYGYLRVPHEDRLVQGAKTPSSGRDKVAMETIALQIIDHMEDEPLYIVGPGTTTRAILSKLGLDKTLIGVDVVWKDKLLASDVNEAQLLNLLEGRTSRIIVTPIGGQGYLFGRGNQQISPKIIKQVGKANIIVVATPEKMDALRGRPFLVDTGDPETDRWLSGYTRVVCGYGEYSIYKISYAGEN